MNDPNPQLEQPDYNQYSSQQAQDLQGDNLNVDLSYESYNSSQPAQLILDQTEVITSAQYQQNSPALTSEQNDDKFKGRSFLSAGLQLPFRGIWHEKTVVQASHLDSYDISSFSWDGSIGHYLEYGQVLFESDSSSLSFSCALKARLDFDFRSDHNVIYQDSDELRLDLSILSGLAMADCQRDLNEKWSSFFDFGLGGALHINGTKAMRSTANLSTTNKPSIFNNYEAGQTGTISDVSMQMQSAFSLGLGLGRNLNDFSQLRFGLNYRQMGDNEIFDKKIRELAISAGITTRF